MPPKNKVSRLLSLVLRHDPASVGLRLDDQGWAEVDELLFCLNKKGKGMKGLDRALLEAVVGDNEKQRFRFSEDGQKICANEGHSLDVDFALQKMDPPEWLYHGTTAKALPKITNEGVLKMSRQHVHLSEDRESAKKVGARHGKPVVIEVAAAVMRRHGHVFFLSENGVWLCKEVPPDYLNQHWTF